MFPFWLSYIRTMVHFYVLEMNGHGHARPSFYWYDNNKDLKVCFLVMRAMLYDDRTEQAFKLPHYSASNRIIHQCIQLSLGLRITCIMSLLTISRADLAVYKDFSLFTKHKDLAHLWHMLHTFGVWALRPESLSWVHAVTESRTGYMKLSLFWKKLFWSLMLQCGPKVHAISNMHCHLRFHFWHFHLLLDTIDALAS